MYLIEILHQTTTRLCSSPCRSSLYLIEILHQTTTSPPFYRGCGCCILSKFYIKPQPSTGSGTRTPGCILSKFYIKPQLFYGFIVRVRSCILSKFYIKPQPCHRHRVRWLVVSYRNSTSNHNSFLALMVLDMLYLIEILHQTTTHRLDGEHLPGCILSKFYIKPQLNPVSLVFRSVVSYRNSTSNHNHETRYGGLPCVVSYRNSTSNHNFGVRRRAEGAVVSYRNSTSNHNKKNANNYGYRVVSYRNSTSNHNCSRASFPWTVVVSYRNSTSNHNLLQEFVNC